MGGYGTNYGSVGGMAGLQMPLVPNLSRQPNPVTMMNQPILPMTTPLN